MRYDGVIKGGGIGRKRRTAHHYTNRRPITPRSFHCGIVRINRNNFDNKMNEQKTVKSAEPNKNRNQCYQKKTPEMYVCEYEKNMCEK